MARKRIFIAAPLIAGGLGLIGVAVSRFFLTTPWLVYPLFAFGIVLVCLGLYCGLSQSQTEEKNQIFTPARSETHGGVNITFNPTITQNASPVLNQNQP